LIVRRGVALVLALIVAGCTSAGASGGFTAAPVPSVPPPSAAVHSAPVASASVLPAPVQAGLVAGASLNAACPFFQLADHVHGTLAGDADDAAWPVWLDGSGGSRLYVRWPEGFRVSFGPRVSLLDEQGDVVASGGDAVDLDQVAPASAAGTRDDPYVASGLVFSTCYVRRPRGSPGVASPAPSALIVPAPIADGIVASDSITAYNAACAAYALQDPVHGVLEGDPAGGAWPIWLRDADGRQLFVRYPEGFTVRFDASTIQLRNERGHTVATNGVDTILDQVAPASAAGTQVDPYIAQGILFNGCYVPRQPAGT
jgi:hypothetical protein